MANTLAPVAEPDVPHEVQRLIAAHIDSVAQLEALLVVRAVPDKRWTAGDVARALVTRPEHAGSLLGSLAGAGMLAMEDETYRYAPADRKLAGGIDALAEAYATRRPTVIGLIFTPRAGDDDVTALADAFRFRKDR